MVIFLFVIIRMTSHSLAPVFLQPIHLSIICLYILNYLNMFVYPINAVPLSECISPDFIFQPCISTISFGVFYFKFFYFFFCIVQMFCTCHVHLLSHIGSFNVYSLPSSRVLLSSFLFLLFLSVFFPFVSLGETLRYSSRYFSPTNCSFPFSLCVSII